MHHYRSLDSGLSSPDDFEQDFGYDHCTPRGVLNVGANEHVLNSTIASQHDSSIQRRYLMIEDSLDSWYIQ